MLSLLLGRVPPSRVLVRIEHDGERYFVPFKSRDKAWDALKDTHRARAVELYRTILTVAEARERGMVDNRLRSGYNVLPALPGGDYSILELQGRVM